MESINALLIRQGLSQSDRLKQLNGTVITQMKSLVSATLTKMVLPERRSIYQGILH
jgi:hypothetical protein